MFSFFANANIPHQVCSSLRHPVRIFSTKFYVRDLTKSCSLLFRPWINHGSILSLFYHRNTVVLFCWLFFSYLLFSFFFHRHPSTINGLSHPSFFHWVFAFFIADSSTTVLSVLILWSRRKIFVSIWMTDQKHHL